MTSITTIITHKVRTTGLEHQGQNSLSDPHQNLGLACFFSPGMQENALIVLSFFLVESNLRIVVFNRNDKLSFRLLIEFRSRREVLDLVGRG